MGVKFPLAVVISAVDKWTGPLSKMTGDINKTLKPWKKMNTEVLDLGRAAGIGQVTSALGGVTSAVGGVVQSFERAFFRIGALTAGIAFALYEVVGGTARAGDEAVKAARKIGISVEAYQELAYAGELANMATGSLQKSLLVFTRNAGAAANGNRRAYNAFAKLGINVLGADHKLRPIPDLLAEVADNMNKLADPGKRNADLFAIFGRGFAEMIPLLDGGSKGLAEAAAEARELNVVLDKDTAEAGQTFLDQWKRFTKALEGIRNLVGRELLPVFEDLAVKLRLFLVKEGPQISAWAKRFAAGLPARLEKLRKLFDALVRGLTPLVEAFADFVEFVGPVPVLLGAIATIITVSVLPAVASLITAIVALSGAIVGTPFGWVLLAASAIVLALAAGVVAIVAFKNNWGGCADYVEFRWNRIKAAFSINPFESFIRFLREAIAISLDFSRALERIVPDWAKNNWAAKAAGWVSGKNLLDAGLKLGQHVLGAAPAAPAAAGESTIKVEFANAPKGLRVSTDKQGGPDIDLSLGYSMVGGQ